MMDATALRLGIHELIGDYAERIDEDRLEEWPELFADPCRYLVISRANQSWSASANDAAAIS